MPHAAPSCQTRASDCVHKSGIDFAGWNEANIDKLREWWALGVSGDEIGRRFGITKNAALGKVHRLNLPGRQSPIRRGVERKQRKPRRAPAITLVTVSPPQPITKAPQPKVDRYRGRCCYPIGEPRTPSFRFCDEVCQANSSYCSEHHSICYIRATPAHTLSAFA